MLNGTAGLPWQSGQVLGVPMGRGDVRARITTDTVHLLASGIPIGGGKLDAEPYLDMRSDSWRVRLDDPATLRNVQLTPAVCRSWLKFVAPQFADGGCLVQTNA